MGVKTTPYLLVFSFLRYLNKELLLIGLSCSKKTDICKYIRFIRGFYVFL
jgi:hypothetical protein